MKYYHLTNTKNKQSILDNGLNCDEFGTIFLFTNLKQSKHIAVNQLGMFDYVIFQVNKKGITSELQQDNVAEFGASAQWFIKQPSIDAEYITYHSTVSKNPYISIIETQLDMFINIGHSYEQAFDMTVRINPTLVKAYNEVNGTNHTTITADECNAKWND